MSKILESEFRNGLYKNLVEAGYDKKGAQKIIGTKYYDALKEDTKSIVAKLSESIEKETFDVDVNTISNNIGEHVKLKELIS